jgi:hypothetical protein
MRIDCCGFDNAAWMGVGRFDAQPRQNINEPAAFSSASELGTLFAFLFEAATRRGQISRLSLLDACWPNSQAIPRRFAMNAAAMRPPLSRSL